MNDELSMRDFDRAERIARECVRRVDHYADMTGISHRETEVYVLAAAFLKLLGASGRLFLPMPRSHPEPWRLSKRGGSDFCEHGNEDGKCEVCFDAWAAGREVRAL